MKLQDQETNRCSKTSQRLVLTVLHIAMKTKIPLPHPFRSQPGKEQRDSGLIKLIFSGKLVLQVIHFSLHHGSIDGGEASEKYRGDDEITARDGKSQADDETTEIERIAGQGVGPRNGQLIVFSDMTGRPGPDDNPNKGETPPDPKTPARWRGEIQVESGKNESCWNANSGQ